MYKRAYFVGLIFVVHEFGPLENFPLYGSPTIGRYHENSVGLSSTTNPKSKGQPSISLPAQANLTQQKAEPLRCLALRTRGGRLICPMGHALDNKY